MRLISFVALGLALSGCSRPVPIEAASPAFAPKAGSSSAPGPSTPVPGAALPSAPLPSADIPDDQRCDRAIGAPELRRGWPAARVADLAAGRGRGAAEIEAKLVRVVPGYDCGGARTECGDELRHLELVVAGEDGAELTLRGDDYDTGPGWVPGARYAFSVVSCKSEVGAPFTALRGWVFTHRQKGADAKCIAGDPARRLEAWPERELPDLARHLVEPSGFDTQGFVVRRFEPAPCTPGRHCKPQPPPYVELAERVDAPQHTLILETPKPDQIPMKVALRVSVVVCGERGYGGSVNAGVLRAFTRR